MVGYKVMCWDSDARRFRWYHDGLSRSGALELVKELKSKGMSACAFDEDDWLIC